MGGGQETRVLKESKQRLVSRLTRRGRGGDTRLGKGEALVGREFASSFWF